MLLSLTLFSIASLIPLAIIIIAFILSIRRSKDRDKISPFECGFDPIKTARIPFSTRFFLLAVIFLVFDIEIVLLIPICLAPSLNIITEIYLRVIPFILILILGLLHE